MPKYYALAKSFINNTIVEVGDVIDYDGKPGSNLELVPEVKPAVPEAKPSAPKKGAGKAQDEGKDLV